MKFFKQRKFLRRNGNDDDYDEELKITRIITTPREWPDSINFIMILLLEIID